MKNNNALFSRQKTQKESFTSTDTMVSSLNGWMRKLEQSNTSLSYRLLAIENRISLLPQKYTTNIPDTNLQDNKQRLKQFNNKKNTSDPISDDHILSQLTNMSQDIIDIKEQVSLYEQHIHEIEQQKQHLQTQLDNMEHQYRKHSVIMKVHGREIPLEITGIIGGILAFLIAALLLFGGKDIIMSPVFLGIVGIILIVSSLFRSMHTQSFLQNRVLNKELSGQS